jgi:hydrogenase maturation protease
MTTLVLGIGNTLLGDEGAGVHTVRALATRHADREDIRFLDGGTLGFTLAAAIESVRRLIVVDAAELETRPGTVRVFEGEAMDRFLGSTRRRSVHEVGLLDLMAVARLCERLPPRRALVGIQPQSVDWAEAPTPAVAKGMAAACEQVMALIGAWQE